MITLDSVAQLAAGRGLNTLLEGVALLGFSWCALRCFGARSSMTRFAVWFATLLVIALLPFLSFGNARAASSIHLSAFTLPHASAKWLLALWAGIATAFLVRIGISLAHVYRLRRDGVEIQLTTRPELDELFARLHRESRRRGRLLVCDEVPVPTALGFFRPAIVLPAWALRELPQDELRAIVLHELAHLRRWDDWTNLAQKIVKALFFFHPAVWWIDSRLALERELACDDSVLEQMPNARTYAASLVSVAERVVADKMRLGRALTVAQSALGRVREVSLRVAQILDRNRTRARVGWRPAMAMIATLAVIAAVGSPFAPEFVSFQAKQQPVISTAMPEKASIPVTPASFEWAGEGSYPRARTKASFHAEHSRQLTGAREDDRQPIRAAGEQWFVIQAKTKVRRGDRRAKVVLTKTPAAIRSKPMLLVLHSSQRDPEGAVWMFSVWQYTSPRGVQMIEETIVMNSI
jgi:beta-lactamase regulating signal transducer with metallopeptidase domain